MGEAQFVPHRLAGDDARALMAKIEVVEDPEFTRAYPGRVPTRIVVEHTDGDRLEATVEYPRGHSRNPMTRAQVEAKFLDLAGDVPASRAALQALWRLDTLAQNETGALLHSVLRGRAP